MKNDNKEQYNIPFSVAMSVYQKDNAGWFDAALNSVVNQTIKPDEIVLVVDGPVPQSVKEVIKKYKSSERNFKVIYLKENKGHGIARRIGIKNCKNDFIAIMDSDDICVSDRFEQQLSYFATKSVDLVGGDISEFINDKNNVVSHRIVPKTHSEILKYMKRRCPFNQVTVMFRKAAVQAAGGYREWFCDEDYYLWIRMMLNGSRFANTGTDLVHVRVGRDMYNRRGGLKYFCSEAKLQKYMLDRHVITFPLYIANVIKRLIVQVLLPGSLRSWVYKTFARE